uniref:Fibrinogen C-terminal domain-containing protein n=1 Tax=Scleropages formosus TaxID=113540 RepID=A0A8C9SJB4_SCLFO
METWWTLLLLLLTVLLGQAGADRKGNVKVGGQQGQSCQEQMSHSSEPKASRCSYTFVVPQQLTGAVCVTSRTAASKANLSEVAALWAEMRRQKGQLEELRALLGRDNGLVEEVRALRAESSGLNARLTQTYAQLLQQVLQSKDLTLEQQQLESLLLNTTAQVLQVSASYNELERKYEMLNSKVTNQSELITRLEKQCQVKNTGLPQQVFSVETGEADSDVQRDQSATVFRVEPGSTVFSPATEQPIFLTHCVVHPPYPTGPWWDCQHVLDSGGHTSGIYLLRPRNTNHLLQAWCEQDRAQGGWTVIQRRLDGSVNFFRTWEQYKQGFGNLNGEYWLGLEHMYWLTAQADYRLRVMLEDWQSRQVFAEYNHFHLEPESDSYRLRLGEYNGNAGDSLSWHNNKAFTTLDRDRDAYTGNCAHYQKGGWWYHMCAHSNLNGVWYRGGHYRSRYQDGVYWAEFHGGSYSLKKVTMMIKPI